MVKLSVAKTAHQKEIVKIFESMQGAYTLWQLWGDFVTMIACEISNAVDVEHRPQRVEMYNTISSKYSQKEMERFASIFANLVEAYELDQDQDVLGELYMALGLGNDHNGQFFTPYDVCRCMAEMQIGGADKELEEKGWISVNDPAVGAGALLIAFANTCRRRNINYQRSVLFVAQDIDFITACMCYIQISLIGCPGYVYVGNTLTDPCVAVDARGLIPKPSNNLWFTPMYFHEIWHYRRIWGAMDRLCRATFQQAKPEKIAEPAALPKPPVKPSRKKPAIASAQSDQQSEPEKIENEVENIPAENAEIELLTNESGQLMLF